MTRKPRATSRFDERAFHRAFLAADYPECRRLLTGERNSVAAVLLEAKVAWREQRYVEMIAPLSALESGDKRVQLERDILLGAAFGCTKDYGTARARIDRALEEVDDKALEGDALFYKSLIAWMQFDHRESEELASRLLRADSPNDRARAHILLSWIAIRRHDVHQQVTELTKSLDVLAQSNEPDEYYRAKGLMTLALLCRELPLHEHVKRVRETYDTIDWAPGTALPHFQTTRFLGWIDALDGNELAAFRFFRTAMSLAPSDHWRVLCLTDRAYLARNTDERSFANDLLHEAHDLAKTLTWQDTDDEERSALIVLAELFADTSPAISQGYLAQFRSLSSSVLPGLSYGTDPRVRAFGSYSSGMALLRLGEREDAIAVLFEASEIFREFGYGWRAALCALALYEATSRPEWLITARREIAPWPRSWVARDISKASGSRDNANLSVAQRKVLDLLLEGKSNAGIAKGLGRSPYTVRNHIAQLFKIYSVTNRTQLAALFNKRNHS